MSMKKILIVAFLTLWIAAAHDDGVEPPVARLMVIHGSVEPCAMAGYRMGDAALRALALPRNSMDLEVVHHSPRQLQWTCIADGLMAATGATPGKLNLKLETAAGTYSIVRNRKSGKQLTFTLIPAFEKEFLNLPAHRRTAAGLKVMGAPESTIFTVKTP